MNLHWHVSAEKVEHSIEELLSIEDSQVTRLVQPIDKPYWDNAALVLQRIGYPRNKLALPGLIQWLQDINWPGARIAFQTLRVINKSILAPYIERALLEAANDNDTDWIRTLKELVDASNIKEGDFDKKETYKILELSDY